MKKSRYQVAVFAAGGARDLAAELGVSHTSVYKWERSGIPDEYVERFCALTGLDSNANRANSALFRHV